MPTVVALAIRALIQMAVTLGIISLAEKYVLPLINRGIAAIMEVFGVSEENAKDIMSNEILIFAESIGIGVLLLRTKIPTSIAEKLGFSSKGWGKRTLTGKAATVRSGTTASGIIVPGGMIVPTAIEASAIVLKAKSVLSGFSKAYVIILGTLSTTFLGFMVAGNFVDFGNWNSGAYQKTFQKIFSKITFGLLVPDEDYRKTKTVSPGVFDKVYNTYKLEGAVGINDPYKKMTVLFSRNALIDLLDIVGADLLRTTQRASTKDVLLASQLFIIFRESAEAQEVIAAVEKAAAIPKIKVFTGVLTQGKLGEAEPFIAREDDLIDSIDDLQTAAANNLASFIIALPGRIVYEIKIVPTITTKDGFIQRGTVQQIISGYTKAGAPKYRTVINKFAVIEVFVFTERNIRTKIQRIVLGPVDSVAFQPKAADLQIAEQSIKSNLTTSDISEIEKITTDQRIEIKQTETPIIKFQEREIWQPQAGEGTQAYLQRLGNLGFETALFETSIPDIGRMAEPPTFPNIFPLKPSATPEQKTALGILPTIPLPPSNNPNRCLTATIAEFFDVNKINYPSVSDRSKLYEASGLGPASWYTGTAEQNIKLLTALKSRSAC